MMEDSKGLSSSQYSKHMHFYNTENVRDECQKGYDAQIDRFLEIAPVLRVGSILFPWNRLGVLLFLRFGFGRHFLDFECPISFCNRLE